MNAVPGLVVSPSEKIPKYRNWNQTKTPEEQITDFFGNELIPDWLFIKDLNNKDRKTWWPHNSFYKQSHERFIWRPLALENGLSGYNIYYTIVNRVDYLERLCEERYKTASRKYNQKYVQMEKLVRQVQDKYAMLILHMMTKNQFTDQELEKMQPLSVIDMYGPQENYAFSTEELPDMTIPILYCQFWGDHIDLPYIDPEGKVDQEMACLIADLKKLIPHPCTTREITSTLGNSWIKHDYINIYRFVLRVVIGSLLGVFEHCQVIANFEARLKIYKWFCFIQPNPTELASWISENKFLTIYMIREFMFWTITHISFLERFLTNRYYYPSVVRNIYESMDKIRKKFNRYILDNKECLPRVDDMNNPLNDYFQNEFVYYDPGAYVLGRKKWVEGKKWFTWAEHFLDHINKENPDNWPRVMTSAFINKVVGTFAEYDIAYLYSGIIKRIDISAEEKLIDGIMERLDKKIECGYAFLAFYPFGVSAYSIVDLSHAEELYITETSRSEIGKTVCRLLERGVRDFLIVQHFFKNLKKRADIQVHALPLDITQKQIEKYHELYNTMPGQPLPKEAGNYFVCTSCGTIRSVSVNYNSGHNLTEAKAKDREKLKKSSLCCDGISVDLASGKKVCSPSKSKMGSKKRNNIPLSQIMPNQKGAAAVDDALLLGITEIDKGQEGQDLIDINELLAEEPEEEEEDEDDEEGDENDNSSDSEPDEGPPTKKRKTAATIEDQTSIRSKERELKKAAKHLRERTNVFQCPTSELHQISLLGQILELKNYIIFVCPYCLCLTRFSRNSYNNLGGHLSCGCKQETPEPIRCTLCRKDTNPPRFYFVFDDERSDPCVRKMPFCSEKDCIWFRSWTNTFVPISVIRTAYEEHWCTTQFSSNGEKYLVSREQHRGLYHKLKHSLRMHARDKRQTELNSKMATKKESEESKKKV